MVGVSPWWVKAFVDYNQLRVADRIMRYEVDVRIQQCNIVIGDFLSRLHSMKHFERSRAPYKNIPLAFSKIEFYKIYSYSTGVNLDCIFIKNITPYISLE